MAVKCFQAYKRTSKGLLTLMKKVLVGTCCAQSVRAPTFQLAVTGGVYGLEGEVWGGDDHHVALGVGAAENGLTLKTTTKVITKWQ